MTRSHSHKTVDRMLASPLMLIVLLVLAGVIGNATLNVLEKEKITQERADMVRDDVTELEERKTFLEQEIEGLKTPEGQERAFREQFGAAKPGEQVIVLVDDPGSSVYESDVDESFWMKIKDFIGERF